MLPVNLIEFLVWPWVLLSVAQISSCNFLARVEPDRTRYVISDFVPSDYYRNVLFEQELCWSIVVALRHCSHSQSTSDGSEDPLMLTPRNIGHSLRRISTTSPIELSYELLVSYELLTYHGVGGST